MPRNGLERVPKSHQGLLAPDARAMAYLATLMPDGTPQLTPLWFDMEGDYVCVNSARGRVKDRNMRLRPAVAVVIQDPASADRYVQVRGRVVSVTEEGALEHIDRLSMKYRGRHWKPVKGQVRVKYLIAPDSVSVGSQEGWIELLPARPHLLPVE
jgi:PPOX class probable F420-dependent enzyme